MNLLRKTFLAVCVLAGAATSARADIIIDDFSSPNPGIDYLITFNTSNGTTFNTNNIFPGVNRSVTLTVTSPNPQVNSMGGSIGGPAGLFSMSLNNFSSGNAVINYSFSTPTNFVPTGVLGSLQYLSTADAGFGANVPLNFVIMTATGDLTFNTTMNLTATLTPTDVALSNFIGTGDLTQVNGVSITIIGGQAADVGLDEIRITTPEGPPPEPVPAPPAALLALLALPALRYRKRWAKKEPALA